MGFYIWEAQIKARLKKSSSAGLVEQDGGLSEMDRSSEKEIMQEIQDAVKATIPQAIDLAYRLMEIGDDDSISTGRQAAMNELIDLLIACAVSHVRKKHLLKNKEKD